MPTRKPRTRTLRRYSAKRQAQEQARPISPVGGGQGGLMTPSGNAGSAWG